MIPAQSNPISTRFAPFKNEPLKLYVCFASRLCSCIPPLTPPEGHPPMTGPLDSLYSLQRTLDYTLSGGTVPKEALLLRGKMERKLQRQTRGRREGLVSTGLGLGRSTSLG